MNGNIKPMSKCQVCGSLNEVLNDKCFKCGSNLLIKGRSVFVSEETGEVIESFSAESNITPPVDNTYYSDKGETGKTHVTDIKTDIKREKTEEINREDAHIDLKMPDEGDKINDSSIKRDVAEEASGKDRKDISPAHNKEEKKAEKEEKAEKTEKTEKAQKPQNTEKAEKVEGTKEPKRGWIRGYFRCYLRMFDFGGKSPLSDLLGYVLINMVIFIAAVFFLTYKHYYTPFFNTTLGSIYYWFPELNGCLIIYFIFAAVTAICFIVEKATGTKKIYISKTIFGGVTTAVFLMLMLYFLRVTVGAYNVPGILPVLSWICCVIAYVYYTAAVNLLSLFGLNFIEEVNVGLVLIYLLISFIALISVIVRCIRNAGKADKQKSKHMDR